MIQSQTVFCASAALRRLLTAVLFAGGLAACGSEPSAPTASTGMPAIPCVDVRDGETFLEPARGFHRVFDLQYDPTQPAPKGYGDLYLPAGAEGPVPVVLFIHGGGWTGGHRDLRNARLMGEHLACMGVAMFDIDYELAPASNMIEQTQHAKCALRWLRGEAETWGLDPQRVGVTGGSAGGHITGLVATTAGLPEFEAQCPTHPEQDTRVQAAFTYYGIFDFLTMQAQRIDLDSRFSRYMGVTNPTDEDWMAVSPIRYVSPDDPPFLLINGTGDLLVPWQQAVEMGAALDAVGVYNEVLIVEGGQHGFDAFAASPEARRSLAAVSAFVAQFLLDGSP